MSIHLSAEPIPAHVLPETGSDERMHVLSDACWCRPSRLHELDLDTGDRTLRLAHHASVAAVLPGTENQP